eukprot:m.53324 g.53324  ORF g.53324 m.53324 type:complete len:1345 (+) comp12373_c1_seq1:464-4498(+)
MSAAPESDVTPAHGGDDDTIIVRHAGAEARFDSQSPLSNATIRSAFQLPPAATIMLQDESTGEFVAIDDAMPGQSFAVVIKRSKRTRKADTKSRVGTVVAGAHDSLEEVFGFSRGDSPSGSSRPESMGLLREFEEALAKLHGADTSPPPVRVHRKAARRRSRSMGEFDVQRLGRQRSQSDNGQTATLNLSSSTVDEDAMSDTSGDEEEPDATLVLADHEGFLDEGDVGVREVILPCDVLQDTAQCLLRCDLVNQEDNPRHSAMSSPVRGSVGSESAMPQSPSQSSPSSPASSRHASEQLVSMLVVASLPEGGVAEQAGLSVGDFVLEINGEWVLTSALDYTRQLIDQCSGPVVIRVRARPEDMAVEPGIASRTLSARKLAAFFGSDSFGTESPLPDEPAKQGVLFRKVIMTARGKKSKKRHGQRQWKEYRCCLRGHMLDFFDPEEDEHAGARPTAHPSGGRVSVKHGICDIAYDYTKRKNVIRLVAFNGAEYLLQASDRASMLDWIQCIQANSNPDDSQDGNLDLIRRKASDAFLSHAMKTSSTPRTPHHSRISASSSTPRLLSRLSGSGLLNFGRKRSSEWHCPNLFELGLESMCQKFQTELPIVVTKCIEEVERRGLEAEGVYRLGGAASATKALREAFIRSAVNVDLSACDDIHVVSGLLKTYVRDLNPPLLPTALYDQFIKVSRELTGAQRVDALKVLVHQLPDANLRTLTFLIGHLVRVAAADNKMEGRNLAIVFGPTLVRPAADDIASMINDMSQQCSIVETMIAQYGPIFGEEDIVAKPAASLLGVTGGSGRLATALSPVAEERAHPAVSSLRSTVSAEFADAATACDAEEADGDATVGVGARMSCELDAALAAAAAATLSDAGGGSEVGDLGLVDADCYGWGEVETGSSAGAEAVAAAATAALRASVVVNLDGYNGPGAVAVDGFLDQAVEADELTDREEDTDGDTDDHELRGSDDGLGFGDDDDDNVGGGSVAGKDGQAAAEQGGYAGGGSQSDEQGRADDGSKLAGGKQGSEEEEILGFGSDDGGGGCNGPLDGGDQEYVFGYGYAHADDDLHQGSADTDVEVLTSPGGPRGSVRVVDLTAGVSPEYGFVPSVEGFAQAFAEMDDGSSESSSTCNVRRGTPPLGGTPPSSPLPAPPDSGAVVQQRAKKMLEQFDSLVADLSSRSTKSSRGTPRTAGQRAASLSAVRGPTSLPVGLDEVARREAPSPQTLRRTPATAKAGKPLMYKEVDSELPGSAATSDTRLLHAPGDGDVHPRHHSEGKVTGNQQFETPSRGTRPGRASTGEWRRHHSAASESASSTTATPGGGRRASTGGRKWSGGTLVHMLKNVPGPETVI